MSLISKYLLELKEKLGSYRAGAKEIGIPHITFLDNMREKVVASNKTIRKILAHSKGKLNAENVLREISDFRKKSNSKSSKNKKTVRTCKRSRRVKNNNK
jgi:hypothetical protein